MTDQIEMKAEVTRLLLSLSGYIKRDYGTGANSAIGQLSALNFHWNREPELAERYSDLLSLVAGCSR